MKWLSLIFLLSAPGLRAADLGCYAADDVWIDYPQRRYGSDAWAHLQLIPTTPETERTAMDFIGVRPAEAEVLCLHGVIGLDSSLHVWRARRMPKNQLRRIQDSGGHRVWLSPEDTGAGWTRD